MTVLLLIAIFCLVFLILTESMPLAIGLFLAAAALVWLISLLWQDILHKQTLTRRRTALQARWAVVVRHLNGLPLPIDTPAALFYTGEQLILETEREQWVIKRNELDKILLITPDQLRRINDRQLCLLLQIRYRVFFALRDKLRHHDSGIRRAAILILTFQSQPDEKEIWVLVSVGRPQAIAHLIQVSGLRDQSLIRLSRRSKTSVSRPAELSEQDT